MKTLILVSLALFVSQSAFATHAYRSETCKSKTHVLNYKGNYPVGGAYGLSKTKTGDEIELWEKNDTEGDDVTTDNQFEVIAAETTSSKTVKADCGADNDGVDFEETRTRSIVKIKFSQLSKSDEQVVGIKSGAEMNFRCEQTFSMPVKCDK